MDDSVIDLLIEQMDKVLTMDVREGRNIEDPEMEGIYWVEFVFKNPLWTFNRKMRAVAGACLSTSLPPAGSKRFLLVR